jgi:hypothetical protein
MKLIMENWKKFLTESVMFRDPNFNFEWDEAIVHHSEDFPTKDIWLELSTQGRVFDASKMAGKINNTQFAVNCEQMEEEYKSLTPDRQERVARMFESGEIELPIVKKKKEEYTLVAGNTRLTMMGREKCKNPDFTIKVWLIDLDGHNY